MDNLLHNIHQGTEKIISNWRIGVLRNLRNLKNPFSSQTQFPMLVCEVIWHFGPWKKDNEYHWEYWLNGGFKTSVEVRFQEPSKDGKLVITGWGKIKISTWSKQSHSDERSIHAMKHAVNIFQDRLKKDFDKAIKPGEFLIVEREIGNNGEPIWKIEGQNRFGWTACVSENIIFNEEARDLKLVISASLCDQD